MNLVANARDAMTARGHIVISTQMVNVTSGHADGSGLGLASVARAVRAAGGHLRIESAPGGGTRVRIWLSPASTDSPPPALSQDSRR